MDVFHLQLLYKSTSISYIDSRSYPYFVHFALLAKSLSS